MSSQSIDKEKSSKKPFAALDKIKKSKKNNVVNSKEEQAHFNIDSVLKSNEDVAPISSIVTESIELVEPTKIIKEPEIIVENIVPKKTENVNQSFDIASKLKHRSIQDIENVQLKDTRLIEKSNLDVKIETRTSAAIAKDRLREDVLGDKVIAKATPENLAYKRTITANDNLTKILGPSQIQPAEIYADEESSIEENKVVITKDSIFIPWERASERDKKKARKIMKAGVASSILFLTYLTFH